MLKEETKQINLLDSCKEAILCIDENNNICFSNQGCEKLFKDSELLNKHIADIHPECNKKVHEIVKERGAVKIKIRDQTIIAICSPTYDGKDYKGSTIMLIENHLINKATCNQMYLNKKEKKRTFIEIRNKILISLSLGKKTINQMALETGINWKTVEKHLTYLLGKKMIDEVYNSEYLRIFDLGDKGKIRVKELREREREKLVEE